MAQNARSKESTYDSQRRRIEKLMENPDKAVQLPNTSISTHKRYEPPDFVRNVQGSSAGAGSGEFHVYRHLRRKEMSRLKEMEETSVVEELDAQFKLKLEETKRKAEERTLKKKMKRDKKRSKLKQKQEVKSKSDQSEWKLTKIIMNAERSSPSSVNSQSFYFCGPLLFLLYFFNR